MNGWLNLPPVGNATPVRLLGRVQANGNGALTALFVESINGNIGEERSTGSYTVSSDCTFTMSYQLAGSPMIMRGSLSGRGEAAFVVLNPQGRTVDVPPFGPEEINGVVASGTMLQESISHADRHADR